MVHYRSATPCPPPNIPLYTCARLNETHSCWAESLQLQMCVCLIELFWAISVVTVTLLPWCSSRHINKTSPASLLNLHPNWVHFGCSYCDGRINRSLVAASGSDEVEAGSSGDPFCPRKRHMAFLPSQSATAAQHHNGTSSLNKNLSLI